MKTVIFVLAVLAAVTQGKVEREHLTNRGMKRVHVGSESIDTVNTDGKHWRCLSINDIEEDVSWLQIWCDAEGNAFVDRNNVTTKFKAHELRSEMRRSEIRFELENIEIRFGEDGVLITDHVEKIIFKKKSDLPVHLLADQIVHQLNTDIYKHVFWTHNFDRYNNFFPNVGAHMRKRRDMLTERRDLIAQYILKKHATTHYTEGGGPTNYAQSLFAASIKSIEFGDNFSELLGISETLTKAREAESEIISILTKILYKADAIGDHEVGEFITGDLMPGIIKSIKSLENDINILNNFKISTASPIAASTSTAASTSAASTAGKSVIEHLAEYLFDRTNY